MTEKNLRQIIKELINEAKVELDPESASNLLTKLSAYYGNLSTALVDFEQDYGKIKVKTMEEHDDWSIKKVEMYCEITQEYKIYREAQMLLKSMEEVIRAVKYRLRVFDAERDFSKNA